MPHVGIVGGSIGGLTAALMLRDLGCEVDVFERSGTALEARCATRAAIRPLPSRAGNRASSRSAGSFSSVPAKWGTVLSFTGTGSPAIRRSGLASTGRDSRRAGLSAAYGFPNVATRSMRHSNSTRFSSIAGSRNP